MNGEYMGNRRRGTKLGCISESSTQWNAKLETKD